MELPGRLLRKTRERLRLKYRDVEEASQEIARARNNMEFSVGLSRLADIENRGTVPSLFRLYSLCAIYGLDYHEVVGWYGIRLDELIADSAKLKIRETRTVDFPEPNQLLTGVPQVNLPDDNIIDTTYLSPLIKGWGSLSLAALGAVDLKRHRYALVGMDDWFMYPIIPPGSFVQIDEERTEIPTEGFAFEHERPIHFIEHRDGYRLGWCTQRDGLVILQPHSASQLPPFTLRLREIDVIGQVIGVAMRLTLARRRHIRS